MSALTPHAQVVLRSSQEIGVGNVFDAADQYRAHANLFLVRVQIRATQTFQWPWPSENAEPKFPIRVVQGHELKPIKSTSTAIYQLDSSISDGVDLELEFDAALVASALVTIEVRSPDG